jgi:hypothetical protein
MVPTSCQVISLRRVRGADGMYSDSTSVGSFIAQLAKQCICFRKRSIVARRHLHVHQEQRTSLMRRHSVSHDSD